MSVWIIAVLLIAEIAAITSGLIALGFNRMPWISPPMTVVIGSVLMGGLGGCTYCLRGVYLNACVNRTWDTVWAPWYVIRPMVSLVLGGVSYLFVKSGLLLFGATQHAEASYLGVWAVAFLGGLNVDKFIARIESIGQTVWGVEPSRQSKQGRQSESKEE